MGGEKIEGELTIAPATHSIVACTLRYRPRDSDILEHEVLESDVLRVAYAASAAIGRVACGAAAPRFDSCCVLGAVAVDVDSGDVFDNFNLSGVLAYTPHSKTATVVEGAVCNVNVCGVLLHADAVIAAVDRPAEEGDVVCVYSVYAVGVDVAAEVSSFGSIVDVDVLQKHSLGADDGHCPHLRFYKVEALDDRVGGVCYG